MEGEMKMMISGFKTLAVSSVVSVGMLISLAARADDGYTWIGSFQIGNNYESKRGFGVVPTTDDVVNLRGALKISSPFGMYVDLEMTDGAGIVGDAFSTVEAKLFDVDIGYRRKFMNRFGFWSGVGITEIGDWYDRKGWIDNDSLGFFVGLDTRLVLESVPYFRFRPYGTLRYNILDEFFGMQPSIATYEIGSEMMIDMSNTTSLSVVSSLSGHGGNDFVEGHLVDKIGFSGSIDVRIMPKTFLQLGLSYRHGLVDEKEDTFLPNGENLIGTLGIEVKL